MSVLHRILPVRKRANSYNAELTGQRGVPMQNDFIKSVLHAISIIEVKHQTARLYGTCVLVSHSNGCRLI